MDKPLRVGTRKSLLATTQTGWVSDQVAVGPPSRPIETVLITTLGDRDQDTSLSKMSQVGIFTKELDRALLDQRIDFAVHSLKDLPAQMEPDLVIAAIPPRVDPLDALVCAKAADLESLPAGARVGTSSLRRQAQILAARSDLTIVDLRGNLDTRVAKAASGELDAVIVATAGLIRLGRESVITQRLSTEVMLPAVSQGALAIVARRSDETTLAALARLDHAETRSAVAAERHLLQLLGGGCQVPIGALAQVSEQTIRIESVVASADGKRQVRRSAEGALADAEKLVEQLAEALRAGGADPILAAYR